MDCEICGASNARRRAKVEGAILNVCDRCACTGKEVARVEIVPVKKRAIRLSPQMNYSLKEDFDKLVRKHREKTGLTQEQLASKIQERHSIIRRIEEGWEPPLSVIKKLEKYFNISLRSSESISDYKVKVKKEQLTLGDIAEIR